MGDLTKDFSLKEFFVSAKYPDLAKEIPMTPLDQYKCYLLSVLILQPLRDKYKTRIGITSGKRDKRLNMVVGGVPTSEHRFRNYTAAIDFQFQTDAGEVHPKNAILIQDAFEYLSHFFIECFGQLILEQDGSGKPENIHISLPTVEHHGECLTRLADKKTFKKYEMLAP